MELGKPVGKNRPSLTFVTRLGPGPTFCLVLPLNIFYSPFDVTYKMKHFLCALIGLFLLVTACSGPSENKTEAETTPPPVQVPVAEEQPTDLVKSPEPAAAGFDPASLPVSSQTLGGFPYVSLIDGYVKMDQANKKGNSSLDYVKDVAFDRYEFFDGTKLIPIEGRLTTIHAMGKGASAFQVCKTYETLFTDLGGVKVWQGKGKRMTDNKINFEDGRHRNRYNTLNEEEMGIYVVRTAEKEVWLEAYKSYEDAENYWLTVVERKVLPMKATVLPAEQMKKELDANGFVALYINFDTDKATIKPESQPVVEQVAKLLTANPELKLTVEGHTDNVGKPDYNQQLSESRAKAVVAALTGQGVANQRLKAVGLGQTKPLVENVNEENKAKNRRVVLVKMD